MTFLNRSSSYAVAAVCILALLSCPISPVRAQAADASAPTPGSGAMASPPSASSTPATQQTYTTATAPVSGPDSTTIQLGQIEAQQRAQVNSDGFSTDFSKLANSGGPYADARYVLGQTSPALFTLPGDGISQGQITLNACALWSPHYHPRASEVIYVTSGSVNVSFVEENPVTIAGKQYGGRTFNYTLAAGSNVVVPQALIHFVYNPTCSNSSLVTSYNNRDPGAVSIVQSLFNLDSTIIQAATNLQSQSLDIVRSATKATPIIGVDLTCLSNCQKNVQASSSSSGRRF